MQIKNEQEILDIKIRKRIIDDIKGYENQRRKHHFYRRYEVYKDKTYKYVIEKMLMMFKEETVREMAYSISNVSLCRKIVDKLARVYNNGVKRTVMGESGQPNKELTDQVEKLSKVLRIDRKMKKTNRFMKRDKNLEFYIKPEKVIVDGAEKFTISLRPMPPYLYDVVEDANNRENHLCVVLSHYEPPPPGSTESIQTVEQAKVHMPRQSLTYPQGDKKDQLIADTPSDQDAEKRQYIWWSNLYHFTTDEVGEVVPKGNGTENPIGRIPFVNFAEDQDGAFWAEGGEDLIDSSVLVNAMISHTNHIGVTQGYGQLVITGKNLPQAVLVGPSRAIKLEYDKEDPTPSAAFATANPPLADLKSLIEMYVAITLTTNNLSVSGVATQLGNSTAPAAGISLIIDKAESMEDVKDQEQVFHDNEPLIWDVIARWLNLYKAQDLLIDELKEFSLPENIKIQLKFGDPKPIMSEKEKLENIEKRKDLGLNRLVDLIMMDDPSLTEEQALERLKQIAKEQMERMAKMTETVDEGDGSGGEPNPDDDKAGLGSKGPDDGSKDPDQE